jgi:hypothetical protein
MHVPHELRHRASWIWEPQKKLEVVVLVNDAYKTRDCGLPNEGLWSPNIWKSSKRYCSIVNNFLDSLLLYYSFIKWRDMW